jgi:hypothetical protein
LFGRFAIAVAEQKMSIALRLIEYVRMKLLGFIKFNCQIKIIRWLELMPAWYTLLPDLGMPHQVCKAAGRPRKNVCVRLCVSVAIDHCFALRFAGLAVHRPQRSVPL